MKTRCPTAQEIEELVAFLPQLYAVGFSPIIRWHGGRKEGSEKFTWPWPEYEKRVTEFFHVASNECWFDRHYSPEHARKKLDSPNGVETATLAEIKTMLTFCVRGERFGDGFWGSMIDSGHIRRLLGRLIVLESANVQRPSPHRDDL